MCHAASWIISGYRDGHGHIWKNWATRAMNRFPELPVIARCHSYEIRTKYVYRCQSCKAGNMEDRISIEFTFLYIFCLYSLIPDADIYFTISRLWKAFKIN